MENMTRTTKRLGIYARTSRYIDGGIHTIDQQIEAGKDFAKRHNFTEENYTIFSDEGLSGYKIEEDGGDPYTNRPAFLNLMNQVQDGAIDAIWVWENSRLSRNTYASAFIYQKINKINKQRRKHNLDPIVLYVQDSKYDLENPSDHLLKSIMDAFSEYERNMIVARTTRGLYNAINNGKRSFRSLYGYKKANRNADGNFIFEVNDFELDNVKTAYKMFLDGKSLREIGLHLIGTKPEKQNEILRVSSKWGRILKHTEYTSFVLNTEGLKIEHQFEEGKINSLRDLSDINRFWVKSKVYTEEIISIEQWIKIREQLELYRQINRKYKNEFGKNYNVGSNLATGLIKCSCCNGSFFTYYQKYKTKNGTEKRIPYYKHQSIFNNKTCSQKPKTFKIEKIDYILGFFYFYYVLIFDDSEIRKEKTLVSIKQQKAVLKNEIKTLEADFNKWDKLVKAVEKAIEENPENYLRNSEQLFKYEDLKKSSMIKLNEANSKLIEIENKYSGTQAKKEFSNILEDIQFFFLSGDNSKHRTMLNKIIKSVVLYGVYLVIQTETLYFIFKIDKKDKTLEPYKPLPSEFLDKPEFSKRFSEVWERFKNNDLNYKNPEVQKYLQTTFNWQTFIVSDEHIKLDVEINFPAGSTVIYFDETKEPKITPLKEYKRKWARKHRKELTDEEREEINAKRRENYKRKIEELKKS